MPVGILGSGKIGSDLLNKVMESPLLECAMFAGRRDDSPGLARARSIGIPTSDRSIEAINGVGIVFDATSAKSHIYHAGILKGRGLFVIDLTPSRVGKICIPAINLEECLKEQEVNMATCGGQAMTPIARDIMIQHPEIEYMEIVSTISSSSAGIGTRENIDEYTQTTADVLMELAGVPKAKAIIILNPAVPPIDMRNTLIYEVDGEVKRVSRIIKAGGLPGNLDIINKSAIEVAEAYARNRGI